MKMKLKITKIKSIDEIAIFFCITAPFLNMYATPIRSVGVCDFMIMVLLVLFAIKKHRVWNVNRFNLAILSVVVICFMNWWINIYSYASGMAFDITFRTLRFMAYMLMIYIMPKTVSNRDYAIRLFRFFSILATGLLIIQNIVLRIFGVYVDGIVPFWPLMGGDGLYQQIDNIYTINGRPFSFFSEPSSYAMYVGMYLALELFAYKGEKRFDGLVRWFLTFGLLLSGSTTGIACAALVWLAYCIKMIRHTYNKEIRRFVAYMVIIVPIGMFFLIRNTYFLDMLARISQGDSARIRFSGFNAFGINMPVQEKLFGHGMDDSVNSFFMSGIPRLYYYWGALGFLCFALVLVYLFYVGDRVSRIVIVIMIFMNLGSTWSWGQYMLVSGLLIIPKTYNIMIMDWNLVNNSE